MQGAQDDPRIGLHSHQKVESRQHTAWDRALVAIGIADRAAVRIKAEVLALQEELYAVIELVIERHLGDRRLDRDLQLRPVELLECALDNAIVFLVGINQNGIVHGVRRNPHAWKNGIAAAGSGSAVLHVSSETEVRR